jgi:hypothetical protein
MKINWKRVLIAAVWSELLLFAIYLLAGLIPAGLARRTFVYLDWFGLMFLGGLWVTRKIESRFVLHGLLVGLVANILFFPLRPLIGLFWPMTARSGSSRIITTGVLVSFVLKMLGAMAGAYVGGRRRKNLQSIQPAQTTDKQRVPVK